MPKLPSIFFLCMFVGLRAISTAQVQDSTEEEPYETPFNPKANYQTLGIRARVLPWLLGNAGGLNLLLGFELGFLKNHSLSIDASRYSDQDHHDAGYGANGQKTYDGADYNGAKNALFFSYKYYYRLSSMREQMGLSVYSGLDCRIGEGSYSWDRGISKDSVLSSSLRFFSIGPQAGVILNLGEERHFAINLNVALLNTMKTVTQQSTHAMALSENTYHFNTWDMKVGVNLYWWFRYKKTSS